MAILIGSHFFCFIILFICKLIIFVYLCAYNVMRLKDVADLKHEILLNH